MPSPQNAFSVQASFLQRMPSPCRPLIRYSMLLFAQTSRYTQGSFAERDLQRQRNVNIFYLRKEACKKKTFHPCVFFCKQAAFHGARLQKETCQDKDVFIYSIRRKRPAGRRHSLRLFPQTSRLS